MIRIRPSTIVLLGGLVVTLAAGAGTAAHAQYAADNVLRDFEPSGDWILRLDGREVPKARVYSSQRAGSLLVRTSELPSPVLLDLRGRTVSVLDLLKVAERTDGTIDLLADAVLEPAGSFRVVDGEGRFAVAGRDAVIAPRPHKIGPQEGAELLESNPGYQWRAKRYTPDPPALERLRAEKRDIRVLTFFGTWCPHCSEHLPYLLKAEQKLDGAGIEFDYHGLPTTISSDPEAVRWKVEAVPTAIVLVRDQKGERELGRLPTRYWSNPEVGIDLMLHPPGAR
jgi:hypothetical protein